MELLTPEEWAHLSVEGIDESPRRSGKEIANFFRFFNRSMDYGMKNAFSALEPLVDACDGWGLPLPYLTVDAEEKVLALLWHGNRTERNPHPDYFAVIVKNVKGGVEISTSQVAVCEHECLDVENLGEVLSEEINLSPQEAIEQADEWILLQFSAEDDDEGITAEELTEIDGIVTASLME